MLDIYNAVRAECGNLVVGNNDTKYAYLLSPDAPDVDLDLVYAALETLQKNDDGSRSPSSSRSPRRQEGEEIANIPTPIGTKFEAGPTIWRPRASYGSETETSTPP